MRTSTTYSRYNTHLWEYSQITKLAYQVNGEKARKMYAASIARNPQELSRIYKESCIDTNIPLLRTSISRQIQDACFKNKDKHLVTCLYPSKLQPDIYIDQI